MQNKEIDKYVDGFVEKCRQHQLKITPQRVAIYRELVQSKRHPSADLMFRTIRKTFPNISFDTVNRTLQTFTEIGVVDMVEVFGGAKRFDPDVSEHHHLHCTACGKIIDFEFDGYTQLEIPEVVAKNFTVTGRRVVLKGLCDACRQESINPQKLKGAKHE